MNGHSLKCVMSGLGRFAGAFALLLFPATQLQAEGANVALAASSAFASNCFNPFLTAERADKAWGGTGARVDFYDLAPLGGTEVVPAVVRSATLGTDRRCEVAFDGSHTRLAASAAVAALEVEGIQREVPLPDRYTATQGTELLAARRLNPRRIAVVHVGTRLGPNGVETFMLVERMTPLEVVQ